MRHHIAVVSPLTGVAAHVGKEMVNATELAWDHTGVVLETHDDGGDVAQGHAIARGLAARPEVLGIVGHYNADVTLAASGVYDAHGIAMITPIAANPELTELGRRTIFRFCNRNDRTALAIATHLRAERGKKRAAVVTTRTAYGRSMSEEFVRAFTRLGGDVPSSVEVDEGQERFEGEIATLPEELDVIFYGGSFEGAPLLKQLRSAGRTTLLATGDGCWDRIGFLEAAGAAAEQGEGVVVLASTPEPGLVRGSRAFADAYAKQHGAIGNYALNSYDATAMLLRAVEAAGTRATRADVVERLHQTTFAGVAYPQPSAWDAKGDNVASVTALNTVRNGAFETFAVIPNRNSPQY